MARREDGLEPARPVEAVPPPVAEDPAWEALHQDIPSVTVDGIVGPVTWQALVSGMVSF